MQVQWTTIQAVAATGCIDTWILFPFAANRLMTRYPADIPDSWRTRLTTLFGTEDWEPKFYKQRRLIDIFSDEDRTIVEKNLTLSGLAAFYEERLKSAFPKVAPNSRVLKTDSGQPLFQLFFAAANPGRGGDLAIKDRQTHLGSHVTWQLARPSSGPRRPGTR